MTYTGALYALKLISIHTNGTFFNKMRLFYKT